MKAYPPFDGLYIVWHEFSRFGNTEVYNSQLVIKIKSKK